MTGGQAVHAPPQLGEPFRPVRETRAIRRLVVDLGIDLAVVERIAEWAAPPFPHFRRPDHVAALRETDARLAEVEERLRHLRRQIALTVGDGG